MVGKTPVRSGSLEIAESTGLGLRSALAGALIGSLLSVMLSPLTGCNGEGQKQAAIGSAARGTLTVAVVNYPLQYFAERIGGDQVRVYFPAPADEDPAFWIPTADEVAAYQAADLILLNGATYAKWVPKASLPSSKLVNTSAGFSDWYLQMDDAVTHSHGPGGEHAHTGTAFTTWLDFTQAVAQAQAVRDAFVRQRPDHAEVFRANFVALETDLSALDRQLNEFTNLSDSAAAQDGPTLVASHPVYQYLARRYGLDLQAVMWEPDTVPDLSQWNALDQLLASHPARWMIWEGEPLSASTAQLAERDIGSLVFDPCGNRPASGDFLSVMRQNIVNLRVAFD